MIDNPRFTDFILSWRWRMNSPQCIFHWLYLVVTLLRRNSSTFRILLDGSNTSLCLFWICMMPACRLQASKSILYFFAALFKGHFNIQGQSLRALRVWLDKPIFAHKAWELVQHVNCWMFGNGNVGWVHFRLTHCLLKTEKIAYADICKLLYVTNTQRATI